ncbi:MAG: biotin--[acetyl-CoA-carboxylase] ligase [Candidatus Omnitrophota bacterium]|nr:MAG: biotin--[acetyl-CoA-carboxylase] ligase [Candidatus Omnitrophota bacterium]
MEFKRKEIEGIEVYFFKKVTSTMDIAEDFLNKGKEVIVVAEEQSCGRGRYGRKWFSPPGGLYLSWILKREIGSDTVSKIFPVALVETLSLFGISDCRIKFPNDIIVKGKKIAGILVEKKEGCFVVGVGVNLNNSTDKIGDFAISYNEIKKEKVDIVKFLKYFIIKFKELYSEQDKILKMWSEYLIK